MKVLGGFYYVECDNQYMNVKQEEVSARAEILLLLATG